MKAWRWIGTQLIYAIHDRQIAEHGGLAGIRDSGAIEGALTRPRNLAAYATPDAADLAAAYAFGLARNHGFANGNKRVAWIAARIFLADHGEGLTFDAREAVLAVLALAAGTLSEAEFAAWLRARLTRAA